MRTPLCCAARTLGALASLTVGTLLTAAQSPASLPPGEVRAVTFLAREAPRWKADHDCYSCHNNGDAARALLVASRHGHDVGTALDDTLAWLRDPPRWNHNKTTGGIDDKPLARVQFAGALRLAVDAGLAPASALTEAATLLAGDQKADGSWRLDPSQSLGSPTTYGTALATWAATRALVASARPDMTSPIARADAWMRSTSVDRVIDAAAVVLALRYDVDDAARRQRLRALGTIKRGQAPQGGWGPFTTVSAEVFDTALVILALSQLQPRASLAAPAYRGDELARAIGKGREYLEQTQLDDGSWIETTRPSRQESYAQRISTTGWALLALLESRAALSAR